MRLLVVEILNAVLDLAQEFVIQRQALGGVGLHQAARHQSLQTAQRAAGADFGELTTAHDQHQLDGKFNLADATARELDIVGAFGPAGGATLGFFADLAVQLAQAFEDTVVEIAAVDERRHQRTQGQCAPAAQGRDGRHDAALEPGKAFPFAALDLQVLFEHAHADHRRSGVAVGAQREVDPEYKAVSGGFADQRVQPFGHEREVLVQADRTRAVGGAGRLAVVLVDIDEVDVGRYVELARAELAHADDPQLHALALCVQRRAVARVGFLLGPSECEFERDFGQVGHGAGDGIQRRALFHVKHRQPFEHQLACHAHGSSQVAPAVLQLPYERRDLDQPGQARWQQRQLGAKAAAHALHETAVGGVGTRRR